MEKAPTDRCQEGCKLRQRVILSVAKNLRGHYATPRVPTRSFAALRMTAPPALFVKCDFTARLRTAVVHR